MVYENIPILLSLKISQTVFLLVLHTTLFQLNGLSLHKIRKSISTTTDDDSTQPQQQPQQPEELKELTIEELEETDDEAIAVCSSLRDDKVVVHHCLVCSLALGCIVVP